MNTYIFKSQRITITIKANDVDHACSLLDDKILELAEIGVQVPRSWDFYLDSMYPRETV